MWQLEQKLSPLRDAEFRLLVMTKKNSSLLLRGGLRPCTRSPSRVLRTLSTLSSVTMTILFIPSRARSLLRSILINFFHSTPVSRLSSTGKKIIGELTHHIVAIGDNSYRLTVLPAQPLRQCCLLRHTCFSRENQDTFSADQNGKTKSIKIVKSMKFVSI